MNQHSNDDENRVTQKDVAELAGVSRGIVSYVINNGPRPVAPETRERVLQAIAQLGYRPNKHAQQLMREQWGSVAGRDLGLILPSVSLLKRPYYGGILAGIYETAHDHHYRIRFMRFYNELENPALFNELIHREEISGLILMSINQSIQSDADHERIEQIRERMENIVCLEWQMDGLPSVSFDRAAASYKATAHLIKLGYQDIVYLGQEDERVRGYRQALMEHQMPFDPASTFYAYNLAGGYKEVGNMVAQRGRPRAIVAGSDEVAFGILRALREHHISVPQEVALTSIDNIPMSAYATPSLTTVNVPTVEMGRLAVETLIRLTQGTPRTPVSNLLPVNLVVRESCGASIS
jgi:LacI family transcriptional regulator